MKLVRMVGLLILTVVATLSLGVSPSYAEKQLLKRDKDWSTISSKGKDASKIVSYWTDDAVIFQDRGPSIQGKAAITKFVKDSLTTPGFHISWRPEKALVSGDGTVGYTFGTNTITFPGPGGKLLTVNGRYLTTWTKKRGGQWRCTVDMWNSDHQ